MKRMEIDYTTTLYIDNIKVLSRLFRRLKEHYLVFDSVCPPETYNLGASQTYGLLIDKKDGYLVMRIIPGDEVLDFVLRL